jgi:hypothetical protein
MKKFPHIIGGLTLLLIFFALVALFMSCSKQNNPAPTPTPSAPTMSSQEQDLVGNWITKRIASINQATDTVFSYQNYNNPSQCHLTLLTAVAAAGGYECIEGLACSPYTSNWKCVSSTQLQLGAAVYTIKFQSTDSLIIQYNSSRFYLKK